MNDSYTRKRGQCWGMLHFGGLLSEGRLLPVLCDITGTEMENCNACGIKGWKYVISKQILQRRLMGGGGGAGDQVGTGCWLLLLTL